MTVVTLGPERRDGCFLDCGTSQGLVVRHMHCMIRALEFSNLLLLEDWGRRNVPTAVDFVSFEHHGALFGWWHAMNKENKAMERFL
jgi:hypothetical protein